MLRTPAILLVVAIVVAGCGGPDEEDMSVAAGAYASDVRTDPAFMRAVPDAVGPGAQIEAVFPQGTTRGPGFVLERAAADGWEWRYAVHSDTDAPDMVNVFTADEFVDRNFEWDAGPAFSGTDPHLVPTPDDAEPGRWRVCTAPDTPGLCAEFEITAERG